MDETGAQAGPGWVPQACTLPTAQQPLRVAEFDDLFASAVRSVERTQRQQVRIELVPDAAVAAQAADLLVRETECCSFFTFALTATGGRLWLDVAVPDRHVEVLDALAGQAAAGAAS